MTNSNLAVMLTSSLITSSITNQSSESSARGQRCGDGWAAVGGYPALLLSPDFALHPMSKPEPANPQDEREVEKEANEEAQAKKKKVESTFQVSR